jgi:ergothioneine biosynthesis protein EgtB
MGPTAVTTPWVAQRLLQRLVEARQETDRLFERVRPDALFDRPIAERHRLAFYVGHLEAFDWNLLRGPLLDGHAFAPDLDRLFAFGIDPTGTDLPSDTPADWPHIDEIHRYKARVRDAIDAGLDRRAEHIAATSDPCADAAPVRLLNMAIEHRLMHAETLAYLLHQLPTERKRCETKAVPTISTPVSPGQIEIPAGRVALGLPRDWQDRFGWDNEYGTLDVTLPSFAIDRYMVTNGQFEQFVTAGGYEDPSHWTDVDWAWRTSIGLSHPTFWTRDRKGFRLRTMFDDIPLPLDWPAYVSHAEASAFAHWAGMALPTEAEWQRAAIGVADASDGERADGNFNFRRWDPVPVNAAGTNRSEFGVEGLVGNGWEWTASVFEPLPGFRPSPFYPGYSADFFDGHHYTIKGGSPRTAACMLRPSFRNWFRPHYRYVYAGFRCVSR